MISPEHIGLVSAAIGKQIHSDPYIATIIRIQSLKTFDGHTIFPIGSLIIPDRTDLQYKDSSITKAGNVSYARNIAAILAFVAVQYNKYSHENSYPRDGAWSDPANRYDRVGEATIALEKPIKRGKLSYAEASSYAAEYYCDNPPTNVSRIYWIKLIHSLKSILHENAVRGTYIKHDGVESKDIMNEVIHHLIDVCDSLVFQLITESPMYKSHDDAWSDTIDYEYYQSSNTN